MGGAQIQNLLLISVAVCAPNSCLELLGDPEPNWC